MNRTEDLVSPPPEALVARLGAARRAYHIPLGLRERCESFARATLGFLFPHFAPVCAFGPGQIAEEHARLHTLLDRALHGVFGEFRTPSPGVVAGEERERVLHAFVARLPGLYDALLLDAQALCEGDPAARNVDEVILAYPGFLATAFYRVAHELHRLEVPLVPRLITELAHRETGIDIHPGARIGRSFAIDHGTGVVIGETTVLGDRVKLYQGVTLGALSVSKELAGAKRHPTVEDDVIIYANATILGGATIVGRGSVIGGNVWLTHSVPPGSLVTYENVTRRAEALQERVQPPL